ncbi:MAG: alanine/glycine:cation symporter family protein [Bacteroidales bacterium]|jgi:AGCS family alanine or glycine:cation symporter|nr:alanine:cation symporter family protein [Bacteroidales bacterium]MDD2832035.1 alanine/glycine:cation symporter family protein [Bacteroidales bacterium]MDD3209038.1 alanine/glycine:cation symporter family protein [Bacteroidales bacterium]MDD4473666.1 alanine/glycine:cation symporter family protein [Bacteroidales bacterium]MDD5517281.1 alanine/glycine:cation symporter family protein [Bacteroidales bacterium]
MFGIIGDALHMFSSWLNLPLFITLIGGGLFFMVRSGFIPLRYYGKALRAVGVKEDNASGQLSSFQALTSAIAATVGLGNISGVAVAITIGGPGAIFWMWVSACLGMATKFFEGTLSVMYKGKDSAGEMQGGTMYMITEGLGKKWKPLAVLFSLFGMIGTFCLMQSNQLTEALQTVFFTPAGIEDTLILRFIVGLCIAGIVSVVVLGGISRIGKVASLIVPFMVGFYFLLVLYIILTNLSVVPEVFRSIFNGAFNLRAGTGGFAGSVIVIGARRAAFVNEAGVGTASMMHGASRNSEPVREGLVAMIAPSIDSGLVCTLTALAVLINAQYTVSDVQGMQMVMESFERSIPGWGSYLLMVVVLVFAFSTMFSYSYYGTKCTNFLFGAHRAHYYNYLFLATLVMGAVIPLTAVVDIIDIAFAFMAFCTVFTMIVLSPRAGAAIKQYFSK